jgi:hemerythrin-like domain-containing protein
MEGLTMDAFELLKADHKKVAQLFDELEKATGKNKIAVFNQIKNELELHTHIEEKIFYPALEKPAETHDLTLEAYEEHDVVKKLLAKLSRATAPDDEWEAQAKVLRENVEHHVDEEENELFDKAEDALSDQQIETLGSRMETEKARKQGSSRQKQAAAKSAKAGNSNKPGIISKIANFVGLGEDTEKRRATTAKKRPNKTRPAKSGARSSKRSGTDQAKTTSKRATRKSANAGARKRATTTQASKRVRSTASKSNTNRRSGKKAAGKTARRR